MNNNVRKLTDGALMLAIIGIFVLADIQLAGLLTAYSAFLVPLPLALYGVKYGQKDGLIVWAAASLLAMVLGGFTKLFYIASYGICGLYYGDGVKQHKDMAKVIIFTCLIAICTNAITTVVLASLFGYDLLGDIAIYTAVLDKIGYTQMVGANNVASIIKSMIVFSTIALGICEGFIIHFCCKLLLARLKYKVPKADFSRLNAGRWSGYLAFMSFIAYNIFNGRIADPALSDALLVFSTLCSLYLMLYGAIGSYGLLQKYFVIKNRSLRVIIIIIALLLFNLLMMIIGFIYLTTDLKERINTDATN